MSDYSADLATAIADNVRTVIRHADAHAPRSLQSAIGPSEYGHPCQRRIAYRLLGHPETNITDPWKRIIGTAVHAWLAQTFGIDCQEKLPDGRDRYVAEQRVQAWPAPPGNCDLLDRKLRVSIDWKIPGPTALKNYRRTNDPGDAYRKQAHTYGAGWRIRGEQVDAVAIVFLPRNDDLKKENMHVWVEPLDQAVVDTAVERLHSIIATVAALDVENHPDRFGLITAEPSRLCGWCSYFKPLSTDFAQGCPGDTADLTADGILMGAAR